MIFRSIRFKIILWNIALLTLALVLCGTLAYNWIQWMLYRNIDDLLTSRAYGIIESIDTYWETEKQAALDQGIPIKAISKINNTNFIKIARHWVENESNNPDILNIVVQIFDNKGNLLVSSADSSKWRPVPASRSQIQRRDAAYFENITISLNSSKNIFVRSFAIPVKENGQVAYVVRLLTPLSEPTTHLLHLRIILFCVLPLLVFLTGIVGAFLARVSLAPVDNMIKVINLITSKNLRSRVEVPYTKDEIQRLAETFNSMLDRINHDFLVQKRLIQDMSHEIKTPLTIMRGSMEVALKSPRPQERYEKILRDSLEQITRLNSIIETLLVLACFDNHEVTLQIRQFNLNELAKQVLDETAVLAEKKGIQHRLIEDSRVEIEADKDQIKTLLLNLLDNAVKYTDDGGQITVTVGKDERSAFLVVNDTGIGISSEDLAHVFERFYRAKGPGIKEKGFGLGLSLVKSIVTTHQGAISVTSQPEKGTTFSISLPLRQTRAQEMFINDPITKSGG